MIVRNINQEEVRHRWYKAHGGGMAAMLFESSELQGILFFAYGILKPGKVLDVHIDPYEEIYYVIQGQGTIIVGADEQMVTAGDAIWIPCGSPHGMKNNSAEECIVIVTAAMPRA